jgi:hypothetical protein
MQKMQQQMEMLSNLIMVLKDHDVGQEPTNHFLQKLLEVMSLDDPEQHT